MLRSLTFFFVKANTPGCTTQACLFRDEYADFQKIGFQVFGLSSDGETSLKNWKEVSLFLQSQYWQMMLCSRFTNDTRLMTEKGLQVLTPV